MSPALVTTARSHPWGLSAYVPLVGGAPGAATLGLNRTFWGYTTASAAPWINEHAPREARVYAHDTLGASWDQLVRDGVLREDLVRTGSVAGAECYREAHHGAVERAEQRCDIPPRLAPGASGNEGGRQQRRHSPDDPVDHP